MVFKCASVSNWSSHKYSILIVALKISKTCQLNYLTTIIVCLKKKYSNVEILLSPKNHDNHGVQLGRKTWLGIDYENSNVSIVFWGYGNITTQSLSISIQESKTQNPFHGVGGCPNRFNITRYNYVQKLPKNPAFYFISKPQRWKYPLKKGDVFLEWY